MTDRFDHMELREIDQQSFEETEFSGSDFSNPLINSLKRSLEWIINLVKNYPEIIPVAGIVGLTLYGLNNPKFFYGPYAPCIVGIAMVCGVAELLRQYRSRSLG